jgi:hypothetical protein
MPLLAELIAFYIGAGCNTQRRRSEIFVAASGAGRIDGYFECSG